MSSVQLLDSFACLYNKLRPLTEFRGSEKWTKITRGCGFSHVKVITSSHLVGQQDSYVTNFIRSMGPCAMFPMMFGSTLFGFVFRSLSEKAFSTFSVSPLYLYSASSSISFIDSNRVIPYGFPFVFSEGLLDSELIGAFYPMSFGSMTSHLSDYQAQFISMFTNRVIIVPDNDEAGERGVKKSEENLSKYGVTAHTVKLPDRYEDPGDLLRLLIEGSSDIDRNVYEILKLEVYQLTKYNGGSYGKV